MHGPSVTANEKITQWTHSNLGGENLFRDLIWTPLDHCHNVLLSNMSLGLGQFLQLASLYTKTYWDAQDIFTLLLSCMFYVYFISIASGASNFDCSKPSTRQILMNYMDDRRMQIACLFCLLSYWKISLLTQLSLNIFL